MKWLYRILFFLVGLFLLSTGISLSIISGLGSGAWDALNVGLSETIGLTTGTWLVIIGVLLIILNAFLLKNRPDIGAIVTLFITGVFVDFWLLQVFDGVVLTQFITQLTVFLSGLLVMSLGISMYIQAKLPLSPIDNLMMALHKRFGFSLMVAKTIGEITALTLAFFFNGPIGIGTVLVTFAVGPLIQVFSPHFQSFFYRLTATTR
ncbi:membrane protein [Mesobacillus maritimus]|uniref:YczE/YyaS/YitT family protein n=1 Tax=Mesobacillus maritimus TaxID=1643336 RepID=UPI00203FB178|nr:membrane protein [Mesobacillus maritimus]MCM3585542.1 membrane protein [Mesobacillus maritimus]MCM3669802.1 membrane protein [Mesobacillus maritimus]